jgi:hypothetical protein
MSRFKPHLLPSPLTRLRCKHQLTIEETADKLGLSTLCVARLESRTQRIPVCTRRAMREQLAPPSKVVQLSLLDYIAALGDGGE